MKFKITLFTILLFTASNLFSQETKNNPYPDAEAAVTDITRITFFNPGFSYEKKTGRFQSLYIYPYVVILNGFSYSSSMGFKVPVDFDPNMVVQYRFYYNGLKRAELGKRTAMNSMNYLSPFARIAFPKKAQLRDNVVLIKRQPEYGIGGSWGMQRNYGGRFSLDLNLGVGYFIGKEKVVAGGEDMSTWDTGFSPSIHLSLGFWLNRRDSR